MPTRSEVALKSKWALPGKASAILAEALDRVGLAGRGEEKIHLLSGGEQQPVALARLVVKKRALVLSDEPTGALDRANAVAVIDILRDVSNAGCVVSIATHDERIRNRCDTVFSVDANSLVA